MKFTLMGHSSYIARHLSKYLKALQHEVVLLPRQAIVKDIASMGHVIYCIGFTADFRKYPLKVLKAHCGVLGNVLESQNFDTLTYLSSTRIYQGADLTHESSLLKVNPLNPGDIYNISKIMGESMCQNYQKQGVRVVRLSNVYGQEFDSQNYLDCLVRLALNKGVISTQAHADSEKDYVYIQDVVEQIYNVATRGKKNVYNIASGYNVKSKDILTFLKEKTKSEVNNTNEVSFRFPKINTQNIEQEFNFKPRSFFAMLEKDINGLRG